MFNHESYEEVAQHKCRIISETAISETCTMFKQIKKLKLVSKQTDIQAFFCYLCIRNRYFRNSGFEK